MPSGKPRATYEYGRVLFSALGGRIFFCTKVRVMPNGVRMVVGKKYDVTEDLQPYLLKKHRRKEQP